MEKGITFIYAAVTVLNFKKNLPQSKCLPTENLLNKLWNIHTITRWSPEYIIKEKKVGGKCV